MILFVNCCTRKDSRTKRLASALIDALRPLDDKVETVNLYDEKLLPMTEEKIIKRSEFSAKKDFSDEMFKYARQFAKASKIVIAAPFWDLSFPAVLKLYVENIYATGLVSEYEKDGSPRGLCAAEKLYYVTTSGGPFNPKYSFDYFKDLSQNYFGIKNAELILAENLDIFGMDSEKILQDAINSINSINNIRQ